MKKLPLILICLLAATFISASKPIDAHRQGKDYALFFALEDYDFWKPLQHPIDEAKKLDAELSTNYAFETEIVPDPTKQQIYAKLQEYRKKNYSRDGQLLIFFSGHGEFIKSTGEGFLVPKKGRKNDFMQESYIPHSRLKSWVNNIPCRHILLAIDACFSGSIDDRIAGNKGPGKRPSDRNNELKIQRFVEENLKYQTRFYLTSGGLEKTPDRSQFAKQFLAALRSTSSQNPVLTFTGLLSYMESAYPRPRSGEFGKNEVGLKNFLFVRDLNRPLPRPDLNLKADATDWQQAKSQNTLAAYNAYLLKHPKGKFVSLARKKVREFERQAEETADYKDWTEAERRDTKEGYEAYKKAHPRGMFIDLANEKLEIIRNTDLPIPLPRMIRIAGGNFMMGSNESEDEKPPHEVSISSFYLAETEVTFEQYDYYCEQTGKEKPDDEGWGRGKRPVINVSWEDAVAYCQWVSKQTGDRYRLPTEAEWEYAAGGGETSNRTTYAGTNSSLDNYAVYRSNSGSKTAPVKSKQANQLGLYDMSGNVWERCQDWYERDYYDISPSRDPQGPSSGSYRVLRGGSWNIYASDCRVANRNDVYPSIRIVSYGFRLARTP